MMEVPSTNMIWTKSYLASLNLNMPFLYQFNAFVIFTFIFFMPKIILCLKSKFAWRYIYTDSKNENVQNKLQFL